MYMYLLLVCAITGRKFNITQSYIYIHITDTDELSEATDQGYFLRRIYMYVYILFTCNLELPSYLFL